MNRGSASLELHKHVRESGAIRSNHSIDPQQPRPPPHGLDALVSGFANALVKASDEA